MVLYSEGHHYNSDADMWYHIYNVANKSWSSAQKVVGKLRSCAYAQVAEDDDGNLHMVYMDGNASANRDIYYIKYNLASGNWGGRNLVYESPGVNSSWPRIALDSGKIYVNWGHNYSQEGWIMDICMVENDMNGTWPIPKGERKTISDMPTTTSIHSHFVVKDGKVHCIWMDDNHKQDHWNIYYGAGQYNQSINNWEWTNPIRLRPSDAAQYYPAICMDDNNKLHVIYSNKQNPVWHIIKEGDTWKAPKVISSGGTDQNVFAFVKFDQGLLHSVIRQGPAIFYVRGLPDGTWANPIKVADCEFPEYPTLDVDENGDVHVVYSDGDRSHPRNIYYAKVELPGKPPTAIIKTDKTTGLTPLTINFNGSDSTDDGKIEGYRWSFGDGSSAEGKRVSHTYKTAGTYTAVLSIIDNIMRVGTASVEIEVSTGDPQPKIEVSATQGMIPLTVEFDGSGSADFDGEIVAYAWNFGDGASASGVTAVHTYENGGKYPATLTVTDNDNKKATATQEIKVYQKPVAIFTATPMVGKAPLEVQFDASDSYDPDGSINTYKWDYGDGMNSLSKKEKHTYSTPGTFLVVCTIVDDDRYTSTATTEIRILDKPLPPQNINVMLISNKTFLFTDYFNRVTWDENPDNSGLFNPAQYRIYRKTASETEYTFVDQVAAGTFSYEVRGFANQQEAAGYMYAVTVVDDSGLESLYSPSGTVVSVEVKTPTKIGSIKK